MNTVLNGLLMPGKLFMLFLSSADFFSKSFFSKKKKTFRNTIRVSNSLDPDQARRSVHLIWLQTVFKGYQQTTLGGKELTLFTSQSSDAISL